MKNPEIAKKAGQVRKSGGKSLHKCKQCDNLTKNNDFCSKSCWSTYTNLHRDSAFYSERNELVQSNEEVANQNRDYIVYKVTNIVSGFVYVGMTRLSLESRMKGHLKRAKSNKAPFYEDLRTLGTKWFTPEVIHQGLTKEEALKLETSETLEYQELGISYNHQAGSSKFGDKNPAKRPEVRAKISKALMGNTNGARK